MASKRARPEPAAPGGGKRKATADALEARVLRNTKRAKQENEALQNAFRAAEAECRLYDEARLSLERCGSFAAPLGTNSGYMVEGESNGVLLERCGCPPRDWESHNEEFSRAWLELWLASVAPVRATCGAVSIRALKLRDATHKIARDLYLELLEAKDPAAELERVLAVLMRVRVDLGSTRAKLQDFFREASALVPRRPSPRQLLREGKLMPKLQSRSTPQILPTATEVEILVCLSKSQGSPILGSIITERLRRRPGSIARELAHLVRLQFTSNRRRVGYLIQAKGLAALASAQKQARG